MRDDRSNDRSTDQEVEVTTPAGSFRARGTDIVALLTLVTIGCGGFILFDASKEIRAQQMRIESYMADGNKTQQRVVETQEEMNYILTLTPQQRERLNLQMPESLRRKAGR